MGSVYEASLQDESAESHTRYAIKMLLPGSWDDENSRGRFLREVDICRKLEHPGIVKVFDWGTYRPPDSTDAEDVIPFMVMELVSGFTLDDMEKKHQPNPLPLGQTVQ